MFLPILEIILWPRRENLLPRRVAFEPGMVLLSVEDLRLENQRSFRLSTIALARGDAPFQLALFESRALGSELESKPRMGRNCSRAESRAISKRLET